MLMFYVSPIPVNPHKFMPSAFTVAVLATWKCKHFRLARYSRKY